MNHKLIDIDKEEYWDENGNPTKLFFEDEAYKTVHARKVGTHMDQNDFIDILVERLTMEREESVRDKYYAEYLGEELTTALEGYQPYEMHVLMVALKHVAEENYTVHEVFGIEDFEETEIPPNYSYVRINKKGDTEHCLLKGHMQLSRQDEEKLIVEIDCTEKIPLVIVTVPEGKDDVAKKLLDEVRAYMDKHNFYKGQIVACAGSGFLEFMDTPERTWDDVIIPSDIRGELTCNVIWPVEKSELFRKHGLSTKRGVMLEGPPGVGKTMVLSVIANQMVGKATTLVVTSRSIGRVDDISMVYTAARALAPSIVVFEDIDLIAMDRLQGNNSPVVGELLAQLDGLSNTDAVVTIATTNYPELIEKALSERPSRFDRRIAFAYPDLDARRQMLNKFVSQIKLADDVDLAKTADAAVDLSGAFIREIVSTAVIEALKEDPDCEEVVLHQCHLDRAIGKFRAKPKEFGFIKKSVK